MTKKELIKTLEQHRMLVHETNIQKLMQQNKNVLHVGFLFASPICIRDKNVQAQKYTNKTPVNKLKEVLLSYYKKEGMGEEEAA